MKYFAYFFIFLLSSCHSEKILNTKFEFDSNDSVNFCAIRFRDQFDDPKVHYIGSKEEIAVNYLPTAFQLQGNRNIVQPIYLLGKTKEIKLYTRCSSFFVPHFLNFCIEGIEKKVTI